MKAIGIHAHGELSQLTLLDLPEPAPGPGEVLLRVKAAALNHLDIWMRKGRAGVNLPLPHVLGSDASGIVHTVGEGVSTCKQGDEVVLNPGLDCGQCEFCMRGEHSECTYFSIVGMGRHGTFGEFVVAPARNLQPKPSHLTWEEAAALPLAYLTAWRMLMSQARIRPGETILIHGIGGGVALAALQLAQLAGAQTIVTSSSIDKLARASELGASHGIQYQGQGVVAAVMDFTDGRGVDVVVDTVGASTWPINMEILRKGGRVVHCGVTTGPHVEANISAIYWKQLSILGSTMGNHEEFRALLQAVASTGLKPVIDQVYPLEEAAAAQERMEKGQQFGKIVLSVS